MSDSLTKTISVSDAEHELSSIRQALLLDLGVPFPSIDLQFSSALAERQYLIRVHEAPVALGELWQDHFCVKNQESILSTLEVEVIEGQPFNQRDTLFWVPERYEDVLVENNVSVLTPQQYLAYHIAHIMRLHVKDFFGLQEVTAILNHTQKVYGELVAEATKSLPMHKITQVLQRLAAEGVSIRNMRAILSSLIEWSQSEKDPLLLCEYVRIDLARSICALHTDESNVLPVYMLHQDIERIIRDGIRQSAQGAYLDIEPTDSTNIISAIMDTVGPQLKSTKAPVIVTSLDVRRYVKKMLETELFEVSVLSFQEIDAAVNVQPLSQINLRSA